MRDEEISRALDILAAADLEKPVISQQVPTGKPDPFAILVSTILSARTKDEVTAGAADRLLTRASTAEAMLALSVEEISRLIYPVGFYRMKAENLRATAKDLCERFSGRVPDRAEDLLSLKGVGRKTANLVLALAFWQDAICVDTHVHRITNRWGYVVTANPRRTELALRAKLPRPYWQVINRVLVALGRTICRPLSPRCTVCPVRSYCKQVGVGKHR
jgi:endonuclease-3